MRGEHVRAAVIAAVNAGSSPHARGARLGSCPLSASLRIIPACAGSTITARSLANFAGDHPRMRGEHADMSRPLAVSRGSSPHARGAPAAFDAAARQVGIIPACAGSTLCDCKGVTST